MTRIRFEATLSGDADALDVLEGALRPEMADELPGVEASLERIEPTAGRLVLAGGHAPQVRAAANAYLRWARTVEAVLEATDARAPNHPTTHEVP